MWGFAESSRQSLNGIFAENEIRRGPLALVAEHWAALRVKFVSEVNLFPAARTGSGAVGDLFGDIDADSTDIPLRASSTTR